MLKIERDIISASKSMEGFNRLANLDETLLDREIIERILIEPNRRAAAASLLSSASAELSQRQREGLIYFTDLVDDGQEVPDDPAKLAQDLLTARVASTDNKLRGLDLYNLTMSCFPCDKQAIIDDYLAKMAEIHARGEHLGRPGEYGYEEAREYKLKTNIPSFEVGLRLGDSSIAKANITPLIMGIQYFDDVHDYRRDFNTLNLFIGMAKDVWEAKGKPDWQDLDYLIEAQNLPKAAWIIKDPNVADTRHAYREAFFREFKGQQNVPLAAVVKTSGVLAF